ncbi:hypothetical protein AW812_RS18335, partial [Acinetobacter baumannii]|nr:hypothetical protein [Acinetobacter baumannii]
SELDKCREAFEKFARWYVLPLDKSEDGIYLALETQSAWAAFQHQQAKVEELQKRNEALKNQLIAIGYTDNDGQLMRPPLGKRPRFDLLDEKQKRVDVLEQVLKEANEIVDLNIETVERIRGKAKDMQDRNYSVSMLYLLKPIRRVLEQALKGEV